MTRTGIIGLLLGSALTIATPTLAAPSILLQCDGYGGYRGTAETAARLVTVIATLGLFGVPEADRPDARLEGQAGVDACLAAMQDPRVTGNPIRKGEVLLALAIHNLGLGNAQAAFEAAGQAREVPVRPELKPSFDRTVGVSALVVQAVAKLDQNDQAAAEALAVQIAAARPYAMLTNNYAMWILALTPEISDAEAQLLDRRLRIESWGPEERARRRMAAGDWARAASDYRYAIALDANQNDLGAEGGLALALALAGRVADAEAALAVLKDQGDLVVARDKDDERLEVSRSDEFARLARIQLALIRGDIATARAQLAAQPRWLIPAVFVVPVLVNAQAKGIDTADDANRLKGIALSTSRKNLSGKEVASVLMTRLPRWEEGSAWIALARLAASPVSSKRDTSPYVLGTLQSLALPYDYHTDTFNEILLLTGARLAADAGKDRLAVTFKQANYGDGSKTAVARMGQIANGGYIAWTTSGSPEWDAQASRSLDIAELERDLGSIYPKPLPVAPK